MLVPNDSIVADTDEDIVVLTKDGCRVSLSSGNYRVTRDTSGQQILKGEGRIREHLWSEDEPFVGEIPISAVESIYVSEKSFLYYASVVGIAAVVAYYAFLLIVFSGGGSFGG